MSFLIFVIVTGAVSIGCWMKSTSDAAGFAVFKEAVIVAWAIGMLFYNFHK